MLDECVQTVRQHMTEADFDTWRGLRGILQDARRPIQVEVAVLNIVAEKADERIAVEMLDVAYSWARELSRTNEDALLANKARWRRLTALVYRFLDLLQDAPLNQYLGHRRDTLEFLRAIATDSVVDPRKADLALELVCTSKASLDERRSFVELLVVERPTAEVHNPLVLKLLDHTSFPKLRKLVRETQDPQRFHFGAAAALAHFGDLEIKEELHRNVAEFARLDRNLGGRLEYLIWQIEIQHPPTNLLDYIASAPSIESAKQLWAVQRAVELDIPIGEIRNSVLLNAKQVHPSDAIGQTNLIELKRVVLELGILRQDDLPEVKTPVSAPTP
jgi:hypothetical protein